MAKKNIDEVTKMHNYPNCLVYKVSNQYLYYFNDTKAKEIKRGLRYWEAISLVNTLQKEDESIPLNPSGCKQQLYKYTSEKEWDETQFSLISN